ncbi:MAG TPA: phospholipid carrier-dependent glycosyltransferase [Smithella sp.]|nr:phospholipid carrier-dependent glycosyltransferase [Smithella sp.]
MPIINNRIIRHLLTAMICLAVLILLIVEFILNLTPPISRDALIHHLAIPKLWLKHGGFYETTWSVFSYYPMNVDLLYIIPLHFNQDFMAKFIHMGFGIGTALMIYNYLRNKINRTAGLLGILVFLSTPVVIRLSTQAYVDLGLAFFTTAALLAFIRYRDSEFTQFKWLLLSSVAMGLALGTKYNALIAWFFLSVTIVFVYANETKEQWQAIKCGAIFFLVSLLIFSPWLIKNAILTGNPLYPLFQGVLNINTVASKEGTYSIVSGGAIRGIFQYREMMYGESFWDTLLIPLRYFFQGQDHSHRFFDGVLNPVLIIFSPLAFMDKSFLRDKLLFISFSVFFVLAATFLDQTRIRYILPVVPILSILAVMGLMHAVNGNVNVSNYIKNFFSFTVLLIFVFLISQNFLYLKNYYQTINPWNYVSGKESKDAFLNRHVGSYAVMQYINTHTPPDARIKLILVAGRAYYLDREYEYDRSMGMAFISDLVKASREEKTFPQYVQSLGFTHLLVRTDLYLKYLHDNYPQETVNQFLRQMNRTTDIMYEANGHAVIRFIPEGTSG